MFDRGLFSEIMGEGYTEVKPISKTMQGAVIPDLPLEHPDFLKTNTTPSATRNSLNIIHKAFIDELVGDCPSTDLPVQKAQLNETELKLTLMKGGKAGAKLARKMGVYSIEESMQQMIEHFKEFLSAEDLALANKAVRALDVHGFLTIMNDKVYAWQG